MENIKKDVRFKDLFRAIELKDQKIAANIEVPVSLYEELLTDVLERGYLNESGEQVFSVPPRSGRKVLWTRIARLPVHPDSQENDDLLYRWQSVLSTLHTWNYRLYFLLLRDEGETRLYLGTGTHSQTVGAKAALEQLSQAVNAGMPGVELQPLLDKAQISREIGAPMTSYTAAGAVTGLPSFRFDGAQAEKSAGFQTLDQLAFGIRDIYGGECNYALLVTADPLTDAEASAVAGNYRRLGSKLHSAVLQSVTETGSSSESKQAAAGAATGVLGSVLDSLVYTFSKGAVRTSFSQIGAALGLAKNVTVSSSTSVNRQYLDRFAQYAEELTKKHEQRLLDGRNLGFWNTGVYVLGDTKADVISVTGMLRSIYSGRESYLEPIRTHLFSDKSNALKIIRQLDLIPSYQGKGVQIDGFDPTQEEWNILGECYQYVSTPINTRELSLVTSLPRRDVPGLRFTKTAVRFANNAADVTGDTVRLGSIVDMGMVRNAEYRIDINALVRHALVAGSTGSGKSTTCKRMLEEAIDRGVPVLVIEPAKDDYVRWALKQNEHLPPEKQFVIYMPGLDEPGKSLGSAFRELKLNPFQPACLPGQLVDLLSHSEMLTAILNASLPTSDVLPTIIDETVYMHLANFFGHIFEEVKIEEAGDYPLLSTMLETGMQVLAGRSYAPEVRDNLKGCLQTRFSYLTRGTRGTVLNVKRSTEFSELFGRNVIINISRIGSAKDKALIMALLMLNLSEYSRAQYEANTDFREQAQGNKLMHLTLVEEAHNLLRRPTGADNGAGDPQRVVGEFFSDMLSEIRGYGQGFVIVDQIPTRLIEDTFKNTNLKITHRLTAPDDCEIMAAGMALRKDQKPMIASLGVGQAIICGDQDDAASWVKIDRVRAKGGKA
ncbi:MAG: ATP-binding protein [Clostridia bacterium]|nr:ATP-binding protein [Clostridia bacterium]